MLDVWFCVKKSEAGVVMGLLCASTVGSLFKNGCGKQKPGEMAIKLAVKEGEENGNEKWQNRQKRKPRVNTDTSAMSGDHGTSVCSLASLSLSRKPVSPKVTGEKSLQL